MNAMKKSVFGVLVIGLLFSSCATSGTKVTEPVIFSEVVDVAGASKDTLYTKANMWFVDAFRSAESVIQFSDKGSGVIKGKYIGDTVMAGIYICKLSSTVTVEARDGRYRILFENPMYQYVGDALNGMYARAGAEGPVETEELANKVKEEWKKLAASLKTSINAETPSW